MDFIVDFPKTMKGSDSVWVIVDIMIKLAHFVPIKIIYLLQKLEEIYISEIVKLHGILSSIFSNMDLRFTSIFFREFAIRLGNQVEVEFCLPSADRRSDRKDCLVFGIFIEGLYFRAIR